MLAYLLAIIIVVIAAALAFGLAALLHLQGLTYVLFVVILLLIGIAAARDYRGVASPQQETEGA